MIDHCVKARSLWVRAAALLLLSTAIGSAVANDADGLRISDYFVSHRSNEPFYIDQKLDPRVTLHVREVVLVGRERTAAKDGKLLVLIHGGTFPGYVAFDSEYEECSLMRHFARAGWDTFALDLEGYGLSTRPLVMDNLAAFPESKAPMHVAVTVSDVEHVVDFIGALRGAAKIQLLGWSQGASLEAPLYTIRHPDRVARLVLFGVGYDVAGMDMDERRKAAAEREAQKVRYTDASLEGWARLGTKAEFVISRCFDAYRAAHLASDPKSGELRGTIRSPGGRSVDQLLAKPHFDAAKIRVPTLVIRGESDTYATYDDNQRLMNALGGAAEFVEIPNAGHFLHFERGNRQFYESVQRFLDATK